MFCVNATIDRLVWTAEHADAVGITHFQLPRRPLVTKPVRLNRYLAQSPSAQQIKTFS